MSSYTGVTYFQKWSGFLAHPVKQEDIGGHNPTSQTLISGGLVTLSVRAMTDYQQAAIYTVCHPLCASHCTILAGDS